VEWIGQDRGDPFARWIGAALIAEAVLIAMARVLTLVYVVAVQVYRPDEEHLKRIVYVPYVLISIGIVVILAWAGGQLRRTPAGAWREARVAGRIDLALAAAMNVYLVTLAVVGVFSRDQGEGEALVAWLVTGVVALTVVVGLVRDAAGRARPTVER
jgi:hypothetical protein